jgi:hypothetical protein
MPKGSCLCGKITIEYTGQPDFTAICHCSSCKRQTGSMGSFNYGVPRERLTVSGAVPKEVTLIADSGKNVTNCFCGDCGAVLYRHGESFGGVNGLQLVQAGVLDDIDELNNLQPQNELFTKRRLKWNPAFEGLAQHEGMPSA